MQSHASPHGPSAQRITAPFGRRALSPAQIATQVDAAACPASTVAHRWRMRERSEMPTGAGEPAHQTV